MPKQIIQSFTGTERSIAYLPTTPAASVIAVAASSPTILGSPPSFEILLLVAFMDLLFGASK